MNSTKKLLWTLTGLGGMLVLTARAATPPCPAACGTQLVACTKTARLAKRSCRMDCRTSSTSTDLGSCIRGCVGTFRSAHSTCHTDQTSCVQTCHPSPGGSSNADCLGACGQDLGACAHGVATSLNGCVMGCAHGSGRQSCIAGCLSTAQSGRAGCASDFQSCTAACGSTTTTTLPGSPSGAFLN
jgi:hypothetical protein